jgi:putative chitinase
VRPEIAPEIVAQIFSGTPRTNIDANLPHVLGALTAAGIDDKPMVLMAVATIRAETAGFRPLNEGISRFNTARAPGSRPFGLYDNREDLGNQGPPDGERFRGRGFVQLTGRANYQQHGAAIGVDLVVDPDQANDPAIAARLLASFLKTKESRIRTSLAAGDLAAARRLVNGGSHGLDRFTEAYRLGERLWT